MEADMIISRFSSSLLTQTQMIRKCLVCKLSSKYRMSSDDLPAATFNVVMKEVLRVKGVFVAGRKIRLPSYLHP